MMLCRSSAPSRDQDEITWASARARVAVERCSAEPRATSRRLLLGCRLAALLLAAPLEAYTQGARPDTIAGELSVALVISGGASLGVYEAGYLYVLGEVLKRQGIPLHVATGASAGSGNALLSALASCGKPNARPTTDPGFRFWLSTRFTTLFEPAAGTPVSAFTARPGLDVLRQLVRETWARGLPAVCDVVLGIPVTKITPLTVPLRPGSQISAPRQLLRFTVRIRGRGPGQPPLIENVVDPGSRVPQLMLPLAAEPDADPLADLERLLEVIVASGAFPYGFPPVRLGYCVYAAAAGAVQPRCDAAEHTEWFIDGGVFDNVPLRLATALAGRAAHPASRTVFIYLDPDLRAYPLPAAGGADTRSELPGDAFTYGAVLAGGFVQQAHKSELFALLEERPAVLDSVLIATSRYPPASGFLANFFGLFETEFRRFDFYLGMSDALHDLEAWDERLPSLRGRRQLEALWTTEDWRPLRCLRSWIEQTGADEDRECADGTLRDLRVLTQVAVNRVYSSCRALSDAQRQAPIAHRHCRRAAQDSLPPTIVDDALIPLHPDAALRQPEESELDHNLRLLAAYGFHFRDLGLAPEDAQRARRVLAQRLREVGQNVARQQPEYWQASLVRLAALGTVNAIHYEPPPHWRYVVVGTAQEVGASVHPPGVPNWLRLNGAFRIEGIVSLVTQDPAEFAAGVFGGPDVELRPFTRSAYLVTLAGRIGYQLAAGDRFLTESCDADRARGDGRDCSQVVLQSVAAVTAIERIRFQATVDFFTRTVAFDDRTYDVHLALGVQF